MEVWFLFCSMSVHLLSTYRLCVRFSFSIYAHIYYIISECERKSQQLYVFCWCDSMWIALLLSLLCCSILHRALCILRRLFFISSFCLRLYFIAVFLLTRYSFFTSSCQMLLVFLSCCVLIFSLLLYSVFLAFVSISVTIFYDQCSSIVFHGSTLCIEFQWKCLWINFFPLEVNEIEHPIDHQHFQPHSFMKTKFNRFFFLEKKKRLAFCVILLPHFSHPLNHVLQIVFYLYRLFYTQAQTKKWKIVQTSTHTGRERHACLHYHFKLKHFNEKHMCFDWIF